MAISLGLVPSETYIILSISAFNRFGRKVTYSFPVSLPPDAVSLYKGYRAEMQWYDSQLPTPYLADQDLARPQQDRDRLAKQFADALKN